MPDNDQLKRLLTAIELADDQTAYKQLFVLMHAQLKQFAWSILKSKEEAEELVSDLFIKIWQNKTKLNEIEAPLFYFYTSVKNLAINRLQKNKSSRSLNPEEWLVQLNSIYFDPEQMLITEEMMRKIREAIMQLPPKCRLIFKLIKEDGLKYREVAELLHLSVKTVEAQMAIALRRLATCMQLDLHHNALKNTTLAKGHRSH